MNYGDSHGQYYLIVFNSKNHAYFLESILNRLRYDCKILQVPTYLSKSCNVGIIVYTEDAVNASLEKIKASKLDIYKVYRHYFDSNRNKEIYKVI